MRDDVGATAEAWSLQVLYDESFPRVYSYLFSRCGGVAQLAEDLTQSTFLAAARELRKGVAVDSPVAWVLGIARHQMLDHYRREKRALAREISVQEVERTRTQARMNGAAARDRVYAALASLPVAQRTALVLRYLDGLSVLEAANAIGRSVTATESLLARGRVKFRTAYLKGDDTSD